MQAHFDAQVGCMRWPDKLTSLQHTTSCSCSCLAKLPAKSKNQRLTGGAEAGATQWSEEERQWRQAANINIS